MLKSRIIYSIAMIASSIFIWQQMYLAQFDEYDDNYGRLIVAFLLSLIVFLIVFILAFRKKQLFNAQLLALSFFYCLANSPITVFIELMNYKLIFGVNLKVN
jgi:ABC-type Fe3+-siderophore transport system permease subunit